MREQMKGLDELEMGDLWSEARRRAPRAQPEPPPPGRSTSSRIVAAVVAFAVFIVAGAFAWQALRPGPTTVQAPGDGVSGVALWPERTAAGLAQAQALADSGDPTVAWRLDPKEVATRFAEDILGWGPPATGSYMVTVQPGQDPSADVQTFLLAHLAPPCPSPPPGQQMACPPPYDSETIALRQLGTTGATGLWSVTDVRASGLEMHLASGEIVDVGATVATSATFPSTAAAVDEFDAASGYRLGTDNACGLNVAQPLKEGAGTLTIDFPIGSYAACDPSVPSYAWLATAPHPLVQEPFIADPLNPGGAEAMPDFFGLSLIPFALSVGGSPGTPATSTTGASPSTEPSAASASGVSTAGLVENGTLGCTVTFPSSMLTPGEPSGASFRVRNVTDRTVTIAQGVNGMTGSLVFSSGASQLQDSARTHDGIIGPPPSEVRLAPGESATIGTEDTAILWQGPLTVTPRCDGTELQPVTIDVASPGAPRDMTAAIADAVSARGDTFSDCRPVQDDVWVTGTVATKNPDATVDARCAAAVLERPGFDVVVLAWVSPPDAPSVDLATLADKIEAVPTFDFPKGTSVAMSWWTMVVTDGGVSCAAEHHVSQTPNESGYSGGGSCGKSSSA